MQVIGGKTGTQRIREYLREHGSAEIGEPPLSCEVSVAQNDGTNDGREGGAYYETLEERGLRVRHVILSEPLRVE